MAASTTIATPRLPEFCHASAPWSARTQVKLLAIYPLPWGLQPSVTLQNLPGLYSIAPITSSYVATNAEIAPSLGRNLAGNTRSVTAELIEPGTRFENRFTQLDVRVARIFRVGLTRVQGMFDVYNVLNASPVTALNARYGPAWLDAQQILAARMFKFGMQLQF
jgi:hypothetical protein